MLPSGKDINAVNGHIVQRTVAAAGTHIGNVVHDLHAIDDLPEYRMGKIQMEGTAYLGILFGDLLGILLYLCRQTLRLVIVQLGVYLVNIF